MSEVGLLNPIPAEMKAHDTAHNILVDFNAESRRDLLGDSGTTPVGITPLHFNYCVDEFTIRSFRTRLTPALGQKQQAVFSLRQHAVEMQQSGRVQDDCATQNAGWVHEKDAQTGDDTFGGAEVGSTIAAAIENQQLMFDEHRLGNDGTRPPGRVSRTTVTIK